MSYDFRGPNSAAGNPASAARLEVEVPHWATIIRIYNNNLELVRECSNLRAQSESPPIYVAEATLPPGIYQLVATLEERVERKTVSLRPDRLKKIKWDEWKSLKLASSAPRASTVTVTSYQSHTAAALEWSRKETWKAAPGGDRRLFIFVRTAKPERHTSFADGLSLLDACGNTLTRFSDSSVKNAAEGWMAFNASLPSACYVLKREHVAAALHYMPLYLCAGWETQVFLPARSAPSLRALTLNLAPYGSGYRPDDEEASAADTVLESLRSGLRGRHLIDNNKLTILLRRKFQNPWLGILAAHLLLRSGARDRLTESTTDADSELSDLFEEVMRNLSYMETIDDHPDFRALQLKSSEPAPKPFSHPPLLEVGLQRVKRHSLMFADTIPYRSLTDCVIDNVLANCVWTGWRALDRAPLEWNDSSATAGLETTRRRSVSKTKNNDLFPSSVIRAPVTKGPVYRLTRPDSSAEGKLQGEASIKDLLNPIFGVALFQKVSEITNQSGSKGLPEVIHLNVSQVFGELMDSIVPKDVSQVLDLPLSRVEHGLQFLRETGTNLFAQKEGESDVSSALTPTARALLQYALTNAVASDPGTTSSSQAADIILARGGPDYDYAAPERKPDYDYAAERKPDYDYSQSIEESVNKLLAEAARLAAKSKEQQISSEDAERASNLAKRLQAVANALLKYAEFIVVTDDERQMLYANGAFTKLLAQPYGLTITPKLAENTDNNAEKARKEFEEAWGSLLASMPSGLSTVSSPLPGIIIQDWNLRRTIIEDESTHTARAFLNVLRAKDVPSFSLRTNKKLAKLLPSLSLFVASFGSENQGPSVSNASQLEDLVTELEQIVSEPQKGEIEWATKLQEQSHLLPPKMTT